MLEQARKKPGTLLYPIHRSKNDPHVFWTAEVYADDAAFAVHRASEVHAVAAPVFTELITRSDVIIGETSWPGAWTADLAAAPADLAARQPREHGSDRVEVR